MNESPDDDNDNDNEARDSENVRKETRPSILGGRGHNECLFRHDFGVLSHSFGTIHE